MDLENSFLCLFCRDPQGGAFDLGKFSPLRDVFFPVNECRHPPDPGVKQNDHATGPKRLWTWLHLFWTPCVVVWLGWAIWYDITKAPASIRDPLEGWTHVILLHLLFAFLVPFLAVLAVGLLFGLYAFLKMVFYVIPKSIIEKRWSKGAPDVSAIRSGVLFAPAPRKDGILQLIMGVVLLGCGIGITIFSFMAAVSGITGGVYIVCFGLVFVGALQLFRGLIILLLGLRVDNESLILSFLMLAILGFGGYAIWWITR